MEMKRDIMRNKYLLKNIRSGDSKIYINEYLPPAVQDKRRREKDIIEKLDKDGQKDQVQYTKRGLTIRGQPYRKKILPPSPKDIVNLEVDDLERILKLKIKKDAEIKQENSTFSAYTCAVKTHQEIRELYIKLKMCQPGARHIVCAYRINHPEKQHSDDYQDDGEPGAGRSILKLMEDNNISNQVVFVARRYGGIRMGADRFQCYVQSAKAALLTHNLPLSTVSNSINTPHQKKGHDATPSAIAETNQLIQQNKRPDAATPNAADKIQFSQQNLTPKPSPNPSQFRNRGRNPRTQYPSRGQRGDRPHQAN